MHWKHWVNNGSRQEFFFRLCYRSIFANAFVKDIVIVTVVKVQIPIPIFFSSKTGLVPFVGVDQR